MMIRHLPLSRSTCEDRLIWKGGLLGQFSVRSAYYVACSILRDGQEWPSSREVRWRHVWTSRVIPKVKIFAWRLLHGILPTYEALKQRGIHLVSACPVCGEAAETWHHVLFDYSLSQRVWSLLGDWIGVFYRFFSSLNLFWDSVFENRCVHESLCTLPTAIVHSAQRKITDFHEAWSTTSSIDRVDRVDAADIRAWSPPQTGLIKLNVDASFYSPSSVAGLGLVARDWEGTILFSAATKKQQVQNSLFAEVWGIQWCLEVARDQGLNNITV
ncbi:hypothetical protein REPUB_Repub20aG0079800 [Reevesia pubescens]